MWQQMDSFLKSFFIYPDLEWHMMLIGIGLGLVFGAVWLAAHWPPLFKKYRLWIVAVFSAFFTLLAVTFVQIPFQHWIGQALEHFWDPYTLTNWLMLAGIPQILMSGLVQEGAKMVPIVFWWWRSDRKLTPKMGLAIGAMAGAGFDARVLARLDTRWKRRLGKLAYVWPVLRELARTPVVFNAVIDGEHHRCSWLIIAKAARYGGPFLLTRRQSLEKAGFHAVIINARTRFALMGVIMAIALGRAERHRDVRIIPCQRATIPWQPGIPIQLDGEMSGEAPLEIESTALPVHLIYPH